MTRIKILGSLFQQSIWLIFLWQSDPLNTLKGEQIKLKADAAAAMFEAELSPRVSEED